MTVVQQEIISGDEQTSSSPGFSSVLDIFFACQSRNRIMTEDTVPIDNELESASSQYEASFLEKEYDEDHTISYISIVSSVSSNSQRRYQVSNNENEVDMTNAVPPVEIEIRIKSFVSKKFPSYNSGCDDNEEFETPPPPPITTVVDSPLLRRPQAPKHASAAGAFNQMTLTEKKLEFSAMESITKTLSTYSISDRDMELLGSRPRYHTKPASSFSVGGMVGQSFFIRPDTGYSSISMADAPILLSHLSTSRSEPRRGLLKCRRSLKRMRRNSTGAIRKEIKTVLNRVIKPIKRFRKVEEAKAELQRAKGCLV